MNVPSVDLLQCLPNQDQWVRVKIVKMFDNYKKLKKFCSSDTYWKQFDESRKTQNSLFDIRTSEDETAKQGKLWGVAMTTTDWEFYENQKRQPRIGYCTSYTDRKWQLSVKRKESCQNQSRDENFNFSAISTLDTNEEQLNDEIGGGDHEYLPLDDQNQKKQMYQFNDTLDFTTDEMPHKFRHIRQGPRSVKPEINKVANILSATYHMSQSQVQGAIVTVANEQFGRKSLANGKFIVLLLLSIRPHCQHSIMYSRLSSTLRQWHSI